MSHSIRFHEKSRRGCKGCKARRVKCDEVKPQCTACSRRGVECVYGPARGDTELAASPLASNSENNDVQPIAGPAPFVQSLSEGPHYSAKHLLDLRLMHQYSVFTVQSFAGVSRNDEVSDAMLKYLPRLALDHEFLMDTILLVGMIHLACMDPVSRERLPIFLYRDQALRSFRQAVASTSHATINAVRGASVLLATISLAADRLTSHPGVWATNWLALAVGQRNFPHYREPQSPSSGHEENYFASFRYGSFADISTSTSILPHIENMIPNEESDPDWTRRHTLLQAATDVTSLVTILEHPHEQSWLEKKIKAWVFDVMPAEFLEMVLQERPRALVILAHYLVLLKVLPDTWIYQDVARHDIEKIEEIVGTEFREYISVPKLAVQIEDKIAAARFLRGGT